MKKVLFLYVIINIIFSDCIFSHDIPELIPFRKNDKWGLVNQSMDFIVECKFDRLERQYYGEFKVQIDKKYGMISKSGKLLLIANIMILKIFIIMVY